MSVRRKATTLPASPPSKTWEMPSYSTLVHFPGQFLAWNRYLLLDYLDPFETERMKATKEGLPFKCNRLMLFPAVMMFLPILVGNFYLEYQAKGRLDAWTLPSSSTIFTRQAFPGGVWRQIDMCSYIACIGSVCLYLSFFKNPFNLERHSIEDSLGNEKIVRFENRAFNVELSREMLRLHRRIMYLSRHLQAIFTVCTLISMYACILLNGNFRWTFTQVLVFSVLLFAFIIYGIHATLGLITFVLLISAIFQLRQKALLTEQNTVNGKIEKLSRKLSKRSIHSTISHIWREYRSVSFELSLLCQSIDRFTQFWRTPLGFFFLIHITIHGYVTHAILFVDSVPLLGKTILFYAVINMEIALFLLIGQCARVVKLNGAIEGANRKFFLAFQKRGAFAVVGVTSMLKAEGWQLPNRLAPYAFRLFDGYQITSQTFYLVLVDTALFFLLVFKNQ